LRNINFIQLDFTVALAVIRGWVRGVRQKKQEDSGAEGRVVSLSFRGLKLPAPSV
jgi:hypothetical protein